MSAFQEGVFVWHLCPDLLTINLATIEVDKHFLEPWQGEFPNDIRTFTIGLGFLITSLRIAVNRNFVFLVYLYIIAILFRTGLLIVIALTIVSTRIDW